MSLTQTTAHRKPAEAEKKWILIDADGIVVGRLASFIAHRLRGKHRVDFTPHVDCGDHVVVINADRVRFTGRKFKQKLYYRHTGHPGGLKKRSAQSVMNGQFPERILASAVERMMPKESKLARQQFACLRLYSGSEHPHHAQSPIEIDFRKHNNKNVASAPRSGGGISGHALSNTGSLHANILERLDRSLGADNRDNPYFRLKTADLEALAEGLERTRMIIEGSDPDSRRTALLEIARLMPKLPVAQSLSNHALRTVLRRLPDRLLQVMAENLAFPSVAKAAALAIVASVRPMNYRKLPASQNESQALKDLEELFDICRVESFSSVTFNPAPPAPVIEINLWNGVPFDLGGARPRLASSAWLTPDGDLDVKVDGAQIAAIDRLKTCDKSHAASLRVTLKSDMPPSDSVALYLVHGQRVFDRYVFDVSSLFGSNT